MNIKISKLVHIESINITCCTWLCVRVLTSNPMRTEGSMFLWFFSDISSDKVLVRFFLHEDKCSFSIVLVSVFMHGMVREIRKIVRE